MSPSDSHRCPGLVLLEVIVALTILAVGGATVGALLQAIYGLQPT